MRTESEMESISIVDTRWHYPKQTYPSHHAPFHSVSPQGFRTRISLVVPDLYGISSTAVITYEWLDTIPRFSLSSLSSLS